MRQDMDVDEKPDSEESPSDAEARRRRAAELYREIERLKSGDMPRERDERKRPPTPREFTERNVREELERQPAKSDEDKPD